MSTDAATTQTSEHSSQEDYRKLQETNKRPLTAGRVVLYAFLTFMALGWLFPFVWALYNSFRDYAYTAANGYVSFGGFTLSNYTDAWTRGDFTQLFLNSAIITIPAVVFTLLLSTMAAFVLARFSFWFNLPMLILFTAANLLPQQSLLIPLFRFFREVGLLDTYMAVILVHIAFQTGFCTFVLSNYMKALPKSMTEAALVDGAGVWRQYSQIVLPLCRPPLAALAVLQVTWIYNDFFWAVAFLNSGEKFPITSGLQNLRGQFFTDYNLLSAGSILVAVPTIIVFVLLQKQFISGLTLGADKG
ncbi:MAG TPA: carbohydrate ABC transporter permease [Ornithinimicrobium sp.]|uniref:carbohydrate ABC transporter permease n=1 Tax=Ornithinimicrobium sp. TaxID=1977084 RepID=UPI002B47C8E4|nr:carbohydrate ABC transporter permease [Ornithinimicrobium sp.]HKJ11502.1 carbohydrate ABC transporter permease [Ornithinimicrobium sp.]